jgi:DNA-binding response OmpR family regulator
MKKILILDQHAPSRALLSLELTDAGYEVVVSQDAARLLKQMEQARPDLIVMDVQFGSMSGLDLLAQVRLAHYDLPVVIWTNSGYFRQDLRSWAADYYVIKNSNLDELLFFVDRALGSRGIPYFRGGPAGAGANGAVGRRRWAAPSGRPGRWSFQRFDKEANPRLPTFAFFAM